MASDGGGPDLGGLGALAGAWCLLALPPLALAVHTAMRIRSGESSACQPRTGSRWGHPGLLGTRTLMLLQAHVLATTITALALDRWSRLHDEIDQRWALGLIGIHSPNHHMHTYACDHVSTEFTLACFDQIASGVTVLVFVAVAALSALHALASLTHVACENSLETNRLLSARVGKLWAFSFAQPVVLFCATLTWGVIPHVLDSRARPSTSFILCAQATAVSIVSTKVLHSFIERLPPHVVGRFLVRQPTAALETNQIRPQAQASRGAPTPILIQVDGIDALRLSTAKPYRSSLSISMQATALSLNGLPTSPNAAPLSVASRTTIPHLPVPSAGGETYPPSPTSPPSSTPPRGSDSASSTVAPPAPSRQAFV